MPLRSFEMQQSVEVSAPLERVWHVFSDVPAWPSWSPVCINVCGDLGALWTVGARFGFGLRMAKVGIQFNVRVVEHAPLRKVAWTSTRCGITAVRAFSFSTSGDQTVVTDTKALSSALLPIGLC